MFALGSGYGGGGIFLAKGGGCCARLPGLEDLGIEAAVKEDKESEVVAKEDFALAGPGVLMFAGRVVKPVAREGEVLTEGGEEGVAGVVIAIETELWPGRRLREENAGKKDDNEGNDWQTHGQGGTHETHTKGYTKSCANLLLPIFPRSPAMALSVVDPRYPIGKFEKPETITPDDRLNAIATLAELPEQLRNAVDGMDTAELNTPYREGGWTVRQLVHHIADSHMNAFIRVRLALTEDWPTIKPYDEKAWATLHDSLAPMEWSLEIIESLHARWVMLLQSLDDQQWQRGFRHPENGPTTIEVATLAYAWHSRHHVAHVTHLRAKEGW